MLLIAYKTLFIKEVLRFMRIWMQTILPPTITTALYLIIFGRLIGVHIGNMSGISYLEYITPGVLLMTVITNAYANTVSSFYLAKFNHSVEEMLVSPMPNWLILLGFVSGGVARGFVVGLAVFLMTWFFVEIKISSPILFFTTFFLTAAFFSITGFINAIFAKSFDDITIVPNFVLMPLTYLGGMFYDVSMLSEFWQQASAFNPIFYMIDSFRASFFATSVVPVWYSLTVLITMIICASMAAIYLLSARRII